MSTVFTRTVPENSECKLSMRAGEYEITVHKMKSGRWIGSTALAHDSLNSSMRQESFATAEEALTFVGYPWTLLGIPESVKKAM